MASVGLLEDNPRIAKLCSTFLNFAGHHVIVYETSQECLQALLLENNTSDEFSSFHENTSAPSLPVEVLIMDLSLPDINGIDVLHHLASHPHTQALPLILCTAAAHCEVAKALRVAPHAGIVEKPFKLQTLISAIADALHAHA
jgi:CheY-like chemotaxis protein